MSLSPQNPQQAPIKLRRYGELLLEYCELDGRAVLSRVIAPSPESYLSPMLYPGADISALVGMSNGQQSNINQ